MRFILAILLALGLLALPLAGGAKADAGSETCHGQSTGHKNAPMQDNGLAGKQCAEHCMTLASSPAPATKAEPSSFSSVGAKHPAPLDPCAPRTGAAPDTPPPKGQDHA